MKLLHLLSITTCTLIIYARLLQADQSYIGANPKQACNSNTAQAIFLGYTGNGKMICDTKLTFRSQDPYDSLTSISLLFGVEHDELAKANPNYTVDVVDWNKLVYIPITCEHNNRTDYRKLITYTVNQGEDIFYIANNTFEGLTTCQAILAANGDNVNISDGSKIFIRLRCACPTNNQHNAGIDSLLTYVVGTNDTITSISTQLMVDSKRIREANDLPSEDSTIYPFTTLLIPVMNNNSTSERKSSTLSRGAIAGIAAAACAALLAFGGAAIKFNLCGSLCSCFNSTKNYITANYEPKLPKNTAHDVSTGPTSAITAVNKSDRADTVPSSNLTQA